ncbi:MAG: hypothetical protein LBE18_10340 [Planctomycetaceae bacterium]|nr:hypothetical protein [Planctomycetaceae bacterium]
MSQTRTDEEILIEYLDGELSTESRLEVEEQLVREPEMREVLAQLQRDWDSLDLLERTNTDKKLVETTLETVITSVAEKTKNPYSNKRFSLFYVLQLTLLILGAFLVFFFSFRFGERLVPDDNFMLRMESPIIERLDQYLMLLDEDPDLSLLRLLAERRVFLPSSNSNNKIDPSEFLPSSKVRILDAFSLYPSFSELQRRAFQLENLDQTLYSRFYWNNKRFRQLSVEKRHRLRTIHENIESAPRSRELYITLRNYYTWFRALQTYEKAALRRQNLTLEERTAQITALKKQLDDEHPDPLADNPSLPNAIAMVKKEDNVRKLATTLSNTDQHELNLILDSPPDLILETLDRILQSENNNNSNNNDKKF